MLQDKIIRQIKRKHNTNIKALNYECFWFNRLLPAFVLLLILTFTPFVCGYNFKEDVCKLWLAVIIFCAGFVFILGLVNAQRAYYVNNEILEEKEKKHTFLFSEGYDLEEYLKKLLQMWIADLEDANILKKGDYHFNAKRAEDMHLYYSNKANGINWSTVFGSIVTIVLAFITLNLGAYLSALYAEVDIKNLKNINELFTEVLELSLYIFLLVAFIAWVCYMVQKIIYDTQKQKPNSIAEMFFDIKQHFEDKIAEGIDSKKKKDKK